MALRVIPEQGQPRGFLLMETRTATAERQGRNQSAVA
jgi:hypothetical protein